MRRLFLPVESELPGAHGSCHSATLEAFDSNPTELSGQTERLPKLYEHLDLLSYPVIPFKMPGKIPQGRSEDGAFRGRLKLLWGPVILVVRWRIQLNNASLSQSWGIASEAVNSTNFKHFDQKRLFS